MNKENTDKLISDFPRLFEPDFGFECGDGWFQLIYDLARKIEPVIDKLPQSAQDGLSASQVKEKYGTMSFYINEPLGHEDTIKNIRALICYAESKSKYICEKCGEPGVRENDFGWLKTLCEEHRQ